MPTSPIQWSIQSVSTGNLTIPAARLEVELFLRSSLPGFQLLSEQAWIDTGAPLSVIPHHIHNGRLDLCGPFKLLAKFARSDPPSNPVPILLGLEFFLAHQASMNLGAPPNQSTIQLP